MNVCFVGGGVVCTSISRQLQNVINKKCALTKKTQRTVSDSKTLKVYTETDSHLMNKKKLKLLESHLLPCLAFLFPGNYIFFR